jgi:hypothetical protein
MTCLGRQHLAAERAQSPSARGVMWTSWLKGHDDDNELGALHMGWRCAFGNELIDCTVHTERLVLNLTV